MLACHSSAVVFKYWFYGDLAGGSQRVSLLSFWLPLYSVSRSGTCINEGGNTIAFTTCSPLSPSTSNFCTDFRGDSQPSPQVPMEGEKTSLKDHEAVCFQKNKDLIYFLSAYHEEAADCKSEYHNRVLKRIPEQVFLAHNEENFDGTLILLHSLCKHTDVKGPVCSNSSQMNKIGCSFTTRFFTQFIKHLCLNLLIQTFSVGCDPKTVSIARSRSLNLEFPFFCGPRVRQRRTLESLLISLSCSSRILS